jgi:hypothetical protein
MDTNIPGLHQNGLPIDDVFFRALKDNQNLLGRVTVQGKGRPRRLFDKAKKDIRSGEKTSPHFFGQGRQWNVFDAENILRFFLGHLSLLSKGLDFEIRFQLFVLFEK